MCEGTGEVAELFELFTRTRFVRVKTSPGCGYLHLMDYINFHLTQRMTQVGGKKSHFFSQTAYGGTHWY